MYFWAWTRAARADTGKIACIRRGFLHKVQIFSEHGRRRRARQQCGSGGEALFSRQGGLAIAPPETLKPARKESVATALD